MDDDPRADPVTDIDHNKMIVCPVVIAVGIFANRGSLAVV